MSEQVSVTPHASDPRRPRDGDGVVVPISETISQQAQPAPADTSDSATASPNQASADTPDAPVNQPPVVLEAPVRKRGGRWFSAFCALLALIAAVVALAAPTLRPQIAAMADTWIGRGNMVSRVLAPSPDRDIGWRQARDEAMQTVNAHLADYTARIDRLAAAQQATAADVARAVADLRVDRTTSEALSRAVDDLSGQTKELRSTATAIDSRVRATGLLTLALRLRRDVDAGLPIGRDVSALAAAGSYPATVDLALQQLQRINDSAPTMRDLADELDRVIARLVAHSDAGASWANRGWTRLSTLFGGGATSGSGALVERLRGLATDGRFSEAADEIQASSEADLGADWVARVRARATAVVATQSLLSYSLAAYENAFAPGSDVGGRLTQ